MGLKVVERVVDSLKGPRFLAGVQDPAESSVIYGEIRFLKMLEHQHELLTDAILHLDCCRESLQLRK